MTRHAAVGGIIGVGIPLVTLAAIFGNPVMGDIGSIITLVVGVFAMAIAGLLIGGRS